MLCCPERFCSGGVTDIDPRELAMQGVEAVLLDLDNTLVGWQRQDVSQEVLDWLAALKAAGIRLCLVSNTRFGRRLVAMSKDLDIPYVRRAAKPMKRGFRAAMEELSVTPEKTVMVGDQMFTDVLGANRMGIYSIMVARMARREFFGTKVSRIFERILLAHFRRRGNL